MSETPTPLRIKDDDLKNVRTAAAAFAMIEAEAQVARATLTLLVRKALVNVGASPNDEIDEHTGEVRPRSSP